MADLFTLAAAVLSAVETHYAAAGVELPDRRYVSDGLPAWDCEQVTVRVTRTFGTQGSVLAETNAVLGGLFHRTAELEVEVVRCAPTVTDEGAEVAWPTANAIEQSAEAILDDAERVPLAIKQAFDAGNLGSCSGVSLMGWAGKGPDGTYVGGTLTLRVELV